MEALLAQLSFLTDQALHDKNFDPSKLEDLLDLFKGEAIASWAAVEAEQQQAKLNFNASVQVAEGCSDSLMSTSMENLHQTIQETEHSSQKKQWNPLPETTENYLATSSSGATEKYEDASVSSAMEAMKSAFSTNTGN